MRKPIGFINPNQNPPETTDGPKIDDSVLRAVIGEVLLKRIAGERLPAADLVDYTGFDAMIRETLSELGIAVSSNPELSDFQKAILTNLGLTTTEYRDLPDASVANLHIETDLILEKWLAEKDAVVEIGRGYYGLSGETVPVSYVKGQKRTMAGRWNGFYRYHETPLVLYFRTYGDDFSINIYGKLTKDFLEELRLRIDRYLIDSYRGKILNQSLEEITLKEYTREELVYSNKTGRRIDELIRAFVTWASPDSLIKRWGYLLVGLPGTGKTTIGGLLARLRPKGYTMLYCPASEIRDSTKINTVFRMARLLQPTLIQIDDVDLIAKDRHFTEDDAPQKELTSTLMENLDGLQSDACIFVLFTTNDPNGIERAIAKRAGRVSNVISLSGYGECLPKLLRQYANQYGLCLEDKTIAEVLNKLHEKVQEFTPDEANNVCERLYLLHRSMPISWEELEDAILMTYESFHQQRE